VQSVKRILTTGYAGTTEANQPVVFFSQPVVLAKDRRKGSFHFGEVGFEFGALPFKSADSV
jgi:hypothetical protein